MWGLYLLLIGLGFCFGNLFQIWIRRSDENKNKELIKTYDEYVCYLGEEISDLASIASTHGWQSRRIKIGSEFRLKISNMKRKLY